MKRFLIINIFGIGDVLFTTPLVRNIKKNLPDAYIGYICNVRAFDVLKGSPYIDKIFIYEKDEFREELKRSKLKFLKKAVGFFNDVKDQGFDVVIDLSLNKQFSLFLRLAGIKKRIGFNYKNRSPFLTDKFYINGFENKHVVEYYLGLIERLGLKVFDRKLEVFLSEDDKKWADDILRKNNISPGSVLVGIVPGGGESWGPDARYRRWSPEKHAQLADKIIERFSAKVVILGDTKEKDIGARVEENMKEDALSLIGKTTIGQYLALLSRCFLVVMNDGGPLHMAVASGTITVSLIGPVDENVYGPYPLEGHRVVTTSILCRPCYRQFRRADCEHIGCLNQIEVGDVFEKVESILS